MAALFNLPLGKSTVWYPVPDSIRWKHDILMDRPLQGPVGPLTYRVLRGGSWNLNASSARCAYRVSVLPANANSVIGFRCVRGF